MRSRVLVIFAAVLIFGLGIAVYAYNSTSITETVAASCCSCCGDSCPMKTADAKATGETAHKCCCKGGGDSCPVKTKDANVSMSADSKDSCPMMSEKHEGMAGHDMKMANGESCPMMKDGQDAKMSEMHKGMAGMEHKDHAQSGDSCSCACCGHNKENKVTASM